MYALAQFPSQGDLIKFAYDALGIIPCKSEQILDLKIENKSLQKSLQRLANEDGSNYLENFSNHVQALINAIMDLFPSYQLHNSLLDTLKEFFQCYLTTVLDNHTYLDKKKSFEFIIFSTLLPRLPILLLKHKEIYTDFFQKIYVPQNFYWFLRSDNQTPLAYIMQWIYQTENLNHESFHRFDADILENVDFEEQEKDLSNTRNWLNNKSLPAFNQLKVVFDRAFKSHNISTEHQESYLFFLLVARFCTYCIQEIKFKYDKKFLSQITQKIQVYLDSIFYDFNLYKQKSETNKILIKGVIFNIESQVSISNFYPHKNENHINILEEKSNNTINNFMADLANQQIVLAKYLEKTQDTKFSKYQNKIEKGYIFSFVRIELLDQFNKPNNASYHSNISNYFQGYFDVFNKKITFESWLADYKTCNNHIVYPWLEQWIQAVLAFKKDQYHESLNYMNQAFQTIRYSAGKHQERFLEDYLLICLANAKGYKSFKQAYKWGTFMNHFSGLKPLFKLETDDEVKQLYQSKKEDFKVFEKMKGGMDMKSLAKLVFHWKYDSE